MNYYTGRIIPFAGNFAPEGWHICDGSVLNIADYQPLYTLIGTTYGGDGRTTFGLPDLRARLAVGLGQAPNLQNKYTFGETGGVESVVLTSATLGVHEHPATAANVAGTSPTPASGLALAAATAGTAYTNPQATDLKKGALNANVVSGPVLPAPAGHSNMMPTIALNYIILLNGVYPQH